MAELEDGKTIADVAGENNVDAQAIAKAYLAEHQEWLAQAVEEGRITQKQADWMQSHMEEEVQERLCEPFPSGGRGPAGCWGDEPGGFAPGRTDPSRFNGSSGGTVAVVRFK